MALLLTEQEVLAVGTPAMAIDAVEGAMQAWADGKASNHVRRRHRVSGGFLHVMDAAIESWGVMGLKSYTTFRGDRNVFHLLLYSTRTGDLEAILEADWLGRLRTGAASAVVARRLLSSPPETVAIIGAGRQALTQTLAIQTIYPDAQVHVYCRTLRRKEEFSLQLARFGKKDVRYFGYEEGKTYSSALVITATTAREPVLTAENLMPGATVISMGGNHISRREVDRSVVQWAGFVCVDDREQAKIESGPLNDAVSAGVIRWEDVAEMKDLVAGKVTGRESDDEVCYFESHGLAIWDIALACKIVESARSRGIGTTISW